MACLHTTHFGNNGHSLVRQAIRGGPNLLPASILNLRTAAVAPICSSQHPHGRQQPLTPQHSIYQSQRRRQCIRQATSSAAGSGDSNQQGSTAVTPQLNPFTRVVLPTALALLLCNMDRICLSVAIIPMSAEFGWPASLQGVIQSAFLWGYTATQFLGGTLADKYGGKWVLAFGIAWFSIASLLLPAILSPAAAAAGLAVPAMLISRCAVGLGEGMALPSMNNLVATFVPKASKAAALGMCFSGFHAGNLAGLIASPLILLNFGWRALFYIYGILGLPLLAMWLAVVPEPKSKTDQPGSTVQAAPQQGAAGTTQQTSTASNVTVAKLLSHPATWAVIIVNMINHWGYFIYLNWMPTYFAKALGFDLRSSSFLSLLPWVVMAMGSSASGLLADHLVASGTHVTRVRKALQTVAFLVPAVALLFLAQPGLTPGVAVGLMTVALGVTSLGQGAFVANISDIAPRHAGRLFGLCNTFGCLSGVLGVTAVGFIVELFQSFSPVFLITAGLYVLGTAVYLLFASGEKIFD